jgi:hypothetical protein
MNYSPFKQPFRAPFAAPSHIAPMVAAPQNAPQVHTPEEDLPRALQYAADTSGCGFWRMIWPEHILNANQKAMITTTTVMNASESFYAPLKAIRIQRQATAPQLEFVKYLKALQSKHGFRIIYEIDDVVFHEDIPDYNKFKFAFESQEIRNNILQIINLCDEVTVTNEFMRDYFREKTNKREISVIPNFPPEWWIGRYYDPKRSYNALLKHKKKPRILYAGSGAHFDVENKTGQKDDFEDIVKHIIDTRHKYTWIFIGAAPMQLIPYIQRNEIEFHQWQRLYDFPKKIHELEVQMLIAPLQDNNFNKCKSDIKFIEACSMGLPVACQDMVTYKDAIIKFKTGEEMMHKIEETLKRTNKYLENSYSLRKIGEQRFLERDENHDCYLELITTPYGSPNRKNLLRYNDSI